ncbi:Uncharacterised protein [Vibrio cholerae]|nr:Uncharacterised protein [Vibrio cholerae]CSI25354.1 Uncharacterised protein [Vibrio cholerae]
MITEKFAVSLHHKTKLECNYRKILVGANGY